MNLLVVEDDRVFSSILCKHLRHGGFNPLVAFDGMQAMMVARRKELKAVVLDLLMPGGHGFDVLRTLKSSMLTHHLPVVILSSAVSSVTKTEAKALGAAAVFQKPLNFENLIKTLNESIESMAKPSAEVAETLPARKDITLQTVMVVDDDRVLVTMLSRWLKQLGYGTFAAYDVPEALKLVSMQKLNAVILDLDMPGTHGSAIIERLKASNRTSSVPILVLSGSDDPNEVKEVLALGADEFLEKPTDLERVEQALAGLLAKRGMRQRAIQNVNLESRIGKLAINGD